MKTEYYMKMIFGLLYHQYIDEWMELVILRLMDIRCLNEREYLENLYRYILINRLLSSG